MAVRYEGDLPSLVHALQQRGYRIRSAERIAGAPGRTADIELENDVVVRWDAYSLAIWAEGPTPAAARVERYLRHRYDSGRPGRAWAALACGLLHFVRFGGRECAEIWKACRLIADGWMKARRDAAQAAAAVQTPIVQTPTVQTRPGGRWV